jgi:hypothetical protein
MLGVRLVAFGSRHTTPGMDETSRFRAKSVSACTRSPTERGSFHASHFVMGGCCLLFNGRELIRARTGDGIKRAKAADVHMGRPSKLTKHQQREALARLACGDETLVEIARSYAVSHMTISRLRERHAAS